MRHIRRIPDWEKQSSKAAHSAPEGGGTAGPGKSECGFAEIFGIERNADVERSLDEADQAAELTEIRYSAQEVFSRVRERIQEHKT